MCNEKKKKESQFSSLLKVSPSFPLEPCFSTKPKAQQMKMRIQCQKSDICFHSYHRAKFHTQQSREEKKNQRVELKHHDTINRMCIKVHIR